MDFTTALVITIVSMVFSAFFSGMEIAFISSNRVRVELDSQKKGVANHLINFFYQHQNMFISTMLVGNNIMLVVYGMGMAILLEPVLRLVVHSEGLILLAQTLVSTCIILVTGEFLPKTVFRINPNSSLRHFSIPLYVIYWILYPVSWLASLLSRLIMSVLGAKAGEQRKNMLSVGELDDYIQQTIDENKEDKGKIGHEVRIFQNALDFSSTHLRDCMTPRNEIIGVDIDRTDRDRLRRRFSSTGLSKIIVYKEDIDNVLGYIHVSELFDLGVDWRTRIRNVEYAPESMLANAMMRKMLAAKKSIAIVVDEFGGTGGLVTLEDLVEEIFGEFEDEHDRKRIIAEKIGDRTYRFSGRIEIEQLNEDFDLNVPESDEYQTLAGYIIYSMGELPQPGESFEVNGLKFTVLKKSSTKIELVQVERMDREDGDD